MIAANDSSAELPPSESSQAETSPSELPPSQFSLIAMLGLVTLSSFYIAFMSAHGLKTVPIGAVGLAFLFTAFVMSQNGLKMVVACALIAGCLGAATLPLLTLPSSLGWFLGIALWGFAFGLVSGGLMSCFTEIIAHLLILGRITSPGNFRAILQDFKLSPKRRFAAWVLAIAWLGIWNLGWL